MSRRLLSILLLFLYLIPSIGVSGSVHYCGGEVAAIVIIPTDEHPCACGPSEPMDGGCCQDKAFSIKIKDNHKNVGAQVLKYSTGDFIIIENYSTSSVPAALLDKKVQFGLKEKEPPDKKRYRLYESYLI